jgi:hypothetical protein
MLYPLSYERGCLVSLRHSGCALRQHFASHSRAPHGLQCEFKLYPTDTARPGALGQDPGCQLPLRIASLRRRRLTGSVGTLDGSVGRLAASVDGALAQHARLMISEH